MSSSAERMIRRNMPSVYQRMIEGGWEILRRTGSGHIVLCHQASGRKATVPQTPSDHRSDKNNASTMKRIEREVE